MFFFNLTLCCGKRKDNDRVITTVTTTGCKLRNTLFDMPYENKFISPHIILKEYVELVSFDKVGKVE